MSVAITNKDRSKALIITALFHAAVILLFLLIKYTIPERTITEEYGMEVNLGNSDDGFGDEQPEDPNDPALLAGLTHTTHQNNNDADELKDVHTDEHTAEDDRVAITKPKVINPKATQINKKEKENNKKLPVASTTNTDKNTNSQPTEKVSRFGVTNTLNAGGNSAANTKTGGSEGDGNGDGDKGKPGGDPNSKNYNGNGGKGSSSFNHTLSNRHIVTPPSKLAEFNRGGTVKVSVRVDREGTVTVTGVSGSTDPTLNALAKQKAQSIKFNKAGPNDPIEQKGNIIFNFKVGK
jgi:outer membrane biosynthesis protein TonB